MKTKSFLLPLICFLLFGIVACDPKSNEQTESTTATDTAMVDNSYYEEEQARLEKERIEAERLEEEARIAAARKKERKDLRMENAQRFMDDLTSEYMTKLAPASGEQPQTVLTIESYNEDTETLKLTATSSFLACPKGAGCETKEHHEFTGNLVIMGDTGKLDYYLETKNSVLVQSETYSNFWNGFGNWIAQKIVEENSKPQE